MVNYNFNFDFNLTNITSNFFSWSLQGYIGILGFFFWPWVFTVISIYLYEKNQSAVVFAVVMLIFMAAFSNAWLQVGVYTSILQILVSLILTGLFLIFFTKRRG